MLVLTRKSNQSIMIGDEIEVSVLSVMGEKVRIGIQAPQRVPVFRKEIYLEIHREAGAGAPVAAKDDGAAGAPAWRSASVGEESLRRRAAWRGRLAEQQVERAEHHDRDDGGGEDQREHEQREAYGAALVTALEVALERALLGGAAQRVAPVTIERDLLDEGSLPLGEALAHFHGRSCATEASALARSYTATKRR